VQEVRRQVEIPPRAKRLVRVALDGVVTKLTTITGFLRIMSKWCG
jgi:hypothetical protein